MDIVLLAAGSSSRMGKINKLLLPLNGTTMVANSAIHALKYLEKKNESSTLIIVTGYKHFSTEKALKDCKNYIENTSSKINMIIVYNKNYKKGQFTSVQTGVRQVADNTPFFISLADLPGITEKHYEELEAKLENSDAVRAEFKGIPGHPVLMSSKMRNAILKGQKNNKVNNILKKYKVNLVSDSDSAWVLDIDTPDDFKHLN